MKKIVSLLLVLLLLVTGCSAVRLDDISIDKNIDILLTDKVKVYNVNFDGYKYYVPLGLKFIEKEEYNAIFIDKFDNRYYLYVDAISYFHGIDDNFKKTDDTYYFKELNYNKKKGYIQISKIGENYFVEYVFNYAKMEAYAKSENLVSVVNNMSYILRSIKYNDKILESIIGDDVLSYKEETFSLFDTDASQDDFLDVVSRYDPVSSEAKDQEELDLNED